MKSMKKIVFSKFGMKTFSRCSLSESRLQSDTSSKEKSTIDFNDVSNFSKLCDNWWDPDAELRALHTMNPLRVQFIRDGIANTGVKSQNLCQLLSGMKLLDVGCGGGILSEPLARIGANVTGLDASKELIGVAQNHAKLNKNLLSNLKYINSSIEDFFAEEKEKYDVVVASEIIEHVIDKELFLKCCIDVLKPKGSIFITTINKNLISWFGGILVAEYILGILPTGTHDWNKFVTPTELTRLLKQYNCQTKLVHGMSYNPVTNKWLWSPATTINYCCHAVKQEVVNTKVK